MIFYIVILIVIASVWVTYKQSRTDKSTNAIGAFVLSAFIGFFIVGMSSQISRGTDPEGIVKNETVYTLAPGSQAEFDDSNISLVYVDDQGVTKATQTSFDKIQAVSNPTEIIIQEVSYEYGKWVLPWGIGDASVEVITR